LKTLGVLALKVVLSKFRFGSEAVSVECVRDEMSARSETRRRTIELFPHA
jgi:hypothetical protein